jgi:hypothetical protein
MNDPLAALLWDRMPEPTRTIVIQLREEVDPIFGPGVFGLRVSDGGTFECMHVVARPTGQLWATATDYLRQFIEVLGRGREALEVEAGRGGFAAATVASVGATAVVVGLRARERSSP